MNRFVCRKRLLLAILFAVLRQASSQMFDGIPGCRTTKLELVFVVDGSSSVSARSFNLAKQWIRNMTLNFDISPYTTRVAVVQYSTRPRTEFHLDSYNDITEVLNGISNIEYMSGNTQTGRALRYVVEHVFARARRGSAKVAVLLSDGQSQDEVNQAATLFRSEGIATFAIGVGDVRSTARVNELRQLTQSAGYSGNVFMVDDYRSIGQVQESLIDAVCEQTVRECPTAKLDLVFVIDASSTIGIDDFLKVKSWMKKIVEAFDIGPDQTRVAVIQYSSSIQEEFNLGQLLNKNEVLAAIDRMEYVMGDTHTGDALMYMLTHIYTERNGDRPEVPNVAIVMTDGKAQDRTMVETSARKVHEEGITVYSVGVADYSLEEIKIIASDPDEFFVIEALDFDLIELKRVGLIRSICEEAEQTCPSATADIVFLVDGSNSIGYENFQKLKLWMKNIVDAFQVGLYYTRIGVVQFTSRPYLEIDLDEHSNTQSTLLAIQNIRYKMGGTNIGRAIEYTLSNVFTKARNNAPKILIALTDGQSQDDIRSAIRKANYAGIHSLVYGVGNVQPHSLRQMVSQEDNLFHASGFDELQRMHSKLVSLICVKAEPECSSQEIDLHFLVDGSASIGLTNFRKVKRWMQNIVHSFDVGPYTTRVALSQYSSGVQTSFALNRYANKRQILYAIDQLELLGGPTYTGEALRRVRLTGFSTESGGRRGAPKVLIVITDGGSADSVRQAAKDLHNDGVYVFAVGAGNTWTPTMSVIGSEPIVTHVQEAASYDAINKFRRELVGEICRETRPECAETEMDLVFLVDGSSSIGSRNFELIKRWMISFVQRFEIGEYNTKIGVTQYSSSVRSEIDIGAYDGKADLIEAIRRIEYATGNTHTGTALDYIRNIGFSTQHGARRGVPKVLIVLTDGAAQDEVNQAARRLRDTGVEVYTIGVGRASVGHLTAAMSNPTETVYHVRNLNAINTIQSRLLRRVCERVEPDCARTATDLMFLVDGSTSVGLKNWDIVKSFMKNMTQRFRIGPEGVRVGVIQYSTWPRADIVLGQNDNKEELHNAINSLHWKLGDTHTARALRYVPASYRQARSRVNLSSRKLLIVVTDGKPQDKSSIKQAVQALHEDGWRIFAIGIGQVSLQELGLLASDPDSDHVFHADDYDSTRIFQGRLSRLICEESDFDAPLARSTPRTSAAATTSAHNQLANVRKVLQNRLIPAALRATTPITPATVNVLNTTGSSDFSKSSNGVCPKIRRNGHRSTGVDFLQIIGLRKSVAAGILSPRHTSGRPRRGTRKTFRSYRVEAGGIPSMPFLNVLPGGLPREFSLVTTFRMHSRTVKQSWTLINVVASDDNILLSVAFNGPQKSMMVTRSGRTVKSTLRGPLVAELFDRRFHKLELIFDSDSVTAMIDCQQVSSQLEFSERKTNFSDSQVSFITSPSGSVAVDVQDFFIKCQAGDAEECCEIPGLKCSTHSHLLSDASATCGCLPTMKHPDMGKLNFNMGCLATLKLHSELSDCKFRMLCSRDLGDCEQVLAAEKAIITKIAQKIASKIVQDKMSRLVTLLDLNPNDVFSQSNVPGSTVQIVSRRARNTRHP